MWRWILSAGCVLAALGPGKAAALCAYTEPSRSSRTCRATCSVAVAGGQDGRLPAGTLRFRSIDDPALAVVDTEVVRPLAGEIAGTVDFLVRAQGDLAQGTWLLERDGAAVLRVEVSETPAAPANVVVEDISEDRSDGECHDTGPLNSLPEPDVRLERPLHLLIQLDPGAPLPADFDLDLWVLPEGAELPTEDTLRVGAAPPPTLERFRPAGTLIKTTRVANQPVVRGGEVFTVLLRGIHPDGTTTSLAQRTYRVPTAKVTCECVGAGSFSWPLGLFGAVLVVVRRAARRPNQVQRSTSCAATPA